MMMWQDYVNDGDILQYVDEEVKLLIEAVDRVLKVPTNNATHIKRYYRIQYILEKTHLVPTGNPTATLLYGKNVNKISLMITQLIVNLLSDWAKEKNYYFQVPKLEVQDNDGHDKHEASVVLDIDIVKDTDFISDVILHLKNLFEDYRKDGKTY